MKRRHIGPCLILSLFFTATAWAHGAAAQPWLGVYLGNSTSGQIQITGVIPESGAAKADLQEGDIIMALSQRPVKSIDDLKNLIAKTQPGDKVQVTIQRDGRNKKITVAISAKPVDFDHTARHKWITFKSSNRARIGIQMQDLNPQLAGYFNVTGGVLISQIIPATPAAKAGLMAGDIITAWQGQAVNTMTDLYTHLDQARPGEEIRLTLSRHAEKVEKKVILGEPSPEESRPFGFSMEKDHTGDYLFRMHAPPGAPIFHLPLEDAMDWDALQKKMEEFTHSFSDYSHGLDEIKAELKALKKEIRELKEQKSY